MRRDFYINDYQLASYFENQWLDVIKTERQIKSVSRAVPETYIHSKFHKPTSRMLIQAIQDVELSPKTYLEVGPSVGRVCFEVLGNINTFRQAVILEPSKKFLSVFENILIKGGKHTYRYISGLNQLEPIVFDSTELAKRLEHVEFDLINEVCDRSSKIMSYPEFDLVVCLNVLDQCQSPVQTIETAQEKTKPGGLLAVSCSYQWQKKKMTNYNEKVSDISDYFSSDWKKIGENELEYHMRVNERFAQLFMSHVVIYQKR